jgi:hypothetical protein
VNQTRLRCGVAVVALLGWFALIPSVAAAAAVPAGRAWR